MKKIFFVIVLFPLTFSSYSQNFIWAKQMGGSNIEKSNSIVVDDQGNVLTTGYFNNTTDFDPSSSVFNLTTDGAQSTFVSKLDSSGNFIWAKKFGGTTGLGHQGKFISADSQGNVYILGDFESVSDFDPSINTFSMSAGPTGTDFYIVKLDSLGNFIWAKRIGGNDYDYGNSMVVDNNGNVFVTGTFFDTVDFNPNSGIFNLTAGTSGATLQNSFILKLDTNGNFVWAKKIGNGTGIVKSNSITIDPSGNVYTSGTFNYDADFDPSSGVFNLYASSDSYDIYVSKLDSSGSFIWAKKMGGSFDDSAKSIKVDSSGNVYTTGYFESNADFDPNVGVFNMNAAPDKDVFISKLNSFGEFVWAKKVGGGFDDRGNSISIDNSGNLYINGKFSTTADFDPSASVYNLTASTSIDTFILKLTSNGIFVWAKQLSTNVDQSQTVLDNLSNIYTTGGFESTCDFNPNSGVFNLNANFIDIYVQKMDSQNLDVKTIDLFENNISIYPNPSNNYLNIDLVDLDIFKVEIINNLGITVFSEENKSKIDVSTLSTGIYLIKIKIDNKIITKKFMKN